MDLKVCDKCDRTIINHDKPHYVSIQKADGEDMRFAMKSIEVCPICATELKQIIQDYKPQERE